MGRVRNSEQVPHRAGPLVQANKKHKAGKHRTKGMLETETRGRVPSTGSIGKRHKQHVKRSARRKQAVANRDQKIQETIDKKRQIGGMRGAPISIALIPLSSTCNANVMLQHFVQQCQGFATVIGFSGNSTHIKLNNGKNVTLVLPPRNDFWAVLDTLKLCDVALFLLPILDSISAEGMVLLKCAKDQGLPTPFLAVSANFSKSEEKAFLKSVHRFLPVEKIYPVVNAGQISNLFRMITVAKMVVPKTYSMRPGMIIESCQTLQLDPAGISNVLPCFANDPSAVGSNLLEVTGYIRRRNLNPHHLVHISGSGTYRILRIDVNPVQTLESMPKRPGPEPDIRIEASISDSQCPPRFMFDPAAAAVPPEELGETEMNADDMSVASDDLGDEYDDLASQNTMDTDEEEDVKPSGKRLPKGTSDYQADWLIDSDSEKEDKDVIGSDEELESEGESLSGDEDESGEEEEDEMDWMEEQEQLKLAKAARSEAEFPDWVDTPLDTPAKTRFQRYRGLQSFKTSAWDTNENLPKEYSKICQFQNYRHTYKVVVQQDSEDGPGFIPVGQRVTMILKPADDSAATVPVVGQSPLVSLISLLTHENKISVLNLHLNLNEVIKNKETIIFQVGFHRFRAKPILSEVSTGNKHKMLRYAQENMSCMATVFGPIVFPIASVLAFKASESSLVHAGSGALFSIDPSRLIIKRVLLSGYPFRSHGRKSTVRFMFFNRKDIEWFKPIELKTRYGRRGHIREALGTHGHMKCIFDGPMKSQDTVLMPLYKRVFPKWNYEPNVPPYFIYDQYEK